MKTNFDAANHKLPYEPPTFKTYGTISGVTKQSVGSDGATNDGGTPAGPLDPNDPEADTHDGNAFVSD